jgi:hypothetical protein
MFISAWYGFGQRQEKPSISTQNMLFEQLGIDVKIARRRVLPFRLVHVLALPASTYSAI